MGQVLYFLPGPGLFFRRHSGLLQSGPSIFILLMLLLTAMLVVRQQFQNRAFMSLVPKAEENM